ncbi:glycosyltransferase family 2 protein [Clostridium felsineum]|uniref:Glycosyltransferase n=1 Tax=Clostridium felsineum TaxID=36839 RepID=A0A1S8KZH2_9CLOT|nr:glycosyltransferase family 2 protein [Clostridium felsineum]MCR3760857.1 glycosyltransferase family 2 protein [Clostridium felsineum]URZ03963.1 putative glycosyltransferase [Clostridium felsineum]URZ07773.1 putative glycosyltransferase [Clostridium felsineum]URZ12804.1 putative glycosyltransferase [Clostridium felsineum]URZ15233.1 putative glycosyltransferase [Clostridium felsineum DSM 794]
MTDKVIQYSIVVPLYNEELVVKETYKRLKSVMDSTGENYEIIFVNDGSRDKTAVITKEICDRDKKIKFISFSRNFGHQLAITAGMDNSSGNAVVVIDADLQDPPEVILKMIEKWKEGYEVVYGQRAKRKGETFFKKLTARIFYRMLNSMTDIDIPVDTGDFRLIDRKVCDALKTVPERNRYVRGLISWLGFKQIGVQFIREERFAGETKYPLKKMVEFATDAITSFSYKPLKLAMYSGSIISIISFVYLIFVIIQKLFTNGIVAGWTSLVALMLFFNGVILMILGIMGEYIGRIYDEAKGRPLYIIGEKKGF